MIEPKTYYVIKWNTQILESYFCTTDVLTWLSIDY